MKLLTFLSDFGLKSSYVSQMKGVALSMTDATIVDISHEITPHNVFEGAFVLMTAVPYFPVGTVHVAVVDPGVGTLRRGIVVTTKTHVLIGPDNGLLIPAARALGDFTVYEIKNPKLNLGNVSNTFHARDIFTPVAACILNGILFEEIGPVIKDFVNLDFGNFEIKNKTITGKIVYVDGFGNIVTNIKGSALKSLLSYDKKLSLQVGKKKYEVPFVKSYNFVKPGKILATIGSSDYFEIALNQGNAAKKLFVKPGKEIKILFN
ncbi:MAG: S-adenosyl-l-methionine hydroxide adenosyltransferase family protein [Candidatus Thermoplasmatota archaeon]|nr:S-adenosyl-l-methionine hydroxide adenosyltransferase family protein [Candidatus Thermoplasmatota archaeon]